MISMYSRSHSNRFASGIIQRNQIHLFSNITGFIGPNNILRTYGRYKIMSFTEIETVMMTILTKCKFIIQPCLETQTPRLDFMFSGYDLSTIWINSQLKLFSFINKAPHRNHSTLIHSNFILRVYYWVYIMLCRQIPFPLETEWRISAWTSCTINSFDNGLSPLRCQAIIWTNAGLLWTGPWVIYFGEI